MATGTGLVDGAVVNKDAYGIIQGDGGAVDKVAGGADSDKLEGHASTNYYYGGGGSDTFIIDHRYLDTSKAVAAGTADYGHSVDVINDLQGAGGYSATDNDFVAFTGFAAGSGLTLVSSASTATASAPSAVIYFYDLYDAGTGNHYSIAINSTNGHALSSGDYNFF